MPTVYQGVVTAAHKAARAILGQDATITVDGTAYTVPVIFWEPPRTQRLGGGLEGYDAAPSVTVLHEDLDSTPITPGVDTVAIGSRSWLIQEARPDSVAGRIRLVLVGV